MSQVKTNSRKVPSITGGVVNSAETCYNFVMKAVKANFFIQLAIAPFLIGSGSAATSVHIYTSPFKPYSFESSSGPDGIFADVMREISARSQVSFMTQFVPWKRAIVTTQTPSAGGFSLIYPLIRSPDREGQFQWLCRIVEDEAVFFTTADGKSVKTPDDLKQERVGVTHGSPFEQELRALKFTNIEAVVGTDTNALKLNHGRIRAWYVPKIVGLYTFRSAKIDSRPFAIIPSGRTDAIYLAASHALPKPVAEAVAKACEQVQREGVIARIIQSYIQPAVAQASP